MNRKTVLKIVSLVLCSTCLTLFLGCGSSGAANQGAPASISVSLSAPPSSAVVPSGTEAIIATVSNDTSGSGVLWSCTPINTCGSFTPGVTASGVQTTFRAPSVAPSDGKVIIQATSARDTSKSASFVITVSGSRVSVILSPVPPTLIQPGQKIAVGAIVANDPVAAGVNWSCTPTNSCGSFNPPSTASGTLTNYTAPVSAPGGGAVTIIATTVTNSIITSQDIVVSAVPSSATLNGQYVFSVSSLTGTRGTSSVAGSFSADGRGNILSGVADIISPAGMDLHDQILPTTSNPPTSTSSYAVDATGRGTMTLKTANGQTLIFSVALTSASHALLAEIDGNPGSGTLDLQRHSGSGFTATQLLGAYSFTMTGTAKTNPSTKVSFGGILTADGIGGLTNGTLDVNTDGAISSSSFSGTFTAPDANGRGTWNLTGGRSFIYYVISTKALRIFEADTVDLMGGAAYSQGNGVIFLANYGLYEHSGWGAAGLTSAVGQFFIPESDVDISSGISDANTGGSPASPRIGVAVAGGTTKFNANGTLNFSLTDAAGSSTFIMYPVDTTIDLFDPGNPPGFGQGGAGNALLLHTDSNLNGTGIVFDFQPFYAQLSPGFIGNHAIQLTNPVTISGTTNELDLAGVMSGDGSYHLTNGLADYDEKAPLSSAAVLGASLTGTFTPDPTFVGRLSGSITLPTPGTPGAYPFVGPSVTTFAVSIYQISPTHAFIIQADSSAIITGFLFRQLFP